jgi:UDP-N-acetylmuramate dehydrogenase
MKLRAEVELQALNTLRLPSMAQFLASPRNVDEAREALAEAASKKLPLTILGGGSNVVLRRRLPGCVLLPRFGGIEVHQDGATRIVTAGAGVIWHDLVRFCLGQGLSGLENLALIPGCVGAAPIQNIGAYGLELQERFHSLTALSCRDGSDVVMGAAQCVFGYRDSIFKRPSHSALLITGVSLIVSGNFEPRIGYPDVQRELSALGVRPSAVSVAEAVTRIRRRKLPDVRRIPNAGSFFKNPVLRPDEVERLREQLGAVPTFAARNGIKVAAARLIEAAGWKGRQLGRAAVWARQPLVLVNRGDADATDVLMLARAIQSDVADRFGVALELEPSVLGSDD